MLFSTFQSRSQQWVGITPSANTYGNTNGWINAVTTGNLAAVGNQQVSIPRTSQLSGYGQLSPEGQRSIAAQGASARSWRHCKIDHHPDPWHHPRQLSKAGAGHHQSGGDEPFLDPSQHTEMATLQRINQALLIELRSQQEANQMLQAQAMQQMVGQKVQQDNLKSLFQTGSALPAELQRHCPADDQLRHAVGLSLLILSRCQAEAGHGFPHPHQERL